VRVLIFLFSVTSLWLTHSPRAEAQINRHISDLCQSATRQMEQQFNIPLNLLRAISITESGRWDQTTRANVAWPWTVTSGGPGEFFPTKSAAINHVRTLQAKGIKNIDVGCMQINLRYHPDAFKSLDQAFDPYHNAQYGATFLTQLFERTHSWLQAAGHYHSSDPQRNMYYQEKVIGYWNSANAARSKPKTQPTPVPVTTARVDNDRMAQLNQAFKNRVKTQRETLKNDTEGSRQLQEWRSAVSRSHVGQVSAARNRALRMQKERDALAVPTVTARNPALRQSFNQRRNSQLDQWRRTVAKPELLADNPL